MGERLSVKSLNEFNTEVKKFKKELRKIENFPRVEDNLFLFRGMSSKKYDIVGTIAKDKTNLKKGIKEEDFVEDVEKEIFNKFIQRAKIYNHNYPVDYWEWIALARHHGVTTRILDWSEDPQIALWFAVQDKKESMHEDSVIRIFYPGKSFKIQHGGKLFKEKNEKYHPYTNPFEVDNEVAKIIDNGRPSYESVLLYKPSSLNLRIDFQSSWFSIHPFNKRNNEYVKLEPEIQTNEFRTIYIDNKSKKRIRKELLDIGIDSSSIYKDLDHLGVFLREKYFKFNDEVFTDEMFVPGRVVSTMDKLRGVMGLYKSKKIDSIEFYETNGTYKRLIEILSSEEVKSIKTFNNMNREFLAYRAERELFLRLIEKRLFDKKLEYNRLQFYNVTHDNRFLSIDDNKDLYEKILFENIYIFTDGLSKSHVQHCERCLKCEACRKKEKCTKMSRTKYLIVNDEKFKMPSFVIIETEKNGSYLVLEFNSKIFKKRMQSDFIGSLQSMNFILKINAANGDSFIKKYDDLFNSYFDDTQTPIAENLEQPEQYNDKNFKLTFEQAKQIIQNYKQTIKADGENYLEIKYSSYVIDKSEIKNADTIYDKQGNKFKIEEDSLLIPVSKNDIDNRFKNVQSIIEYVFYKLRWKHPNCVLRPFSYGKDRDWYFSDSKGKPIQFEKDNLFEKISGSYLEEIRKTGYERYFFNKKTVDFIKDKGFSIRFCESAKFIERAKKLNNKAIKKTTK